MSVTEPVRVVVEIERAIGTVQGQISVGDAASREFYDRLELIVGLDRAAGLGSAEERGARVRDTT